MKILRYAPRGRDLLMILLAALLLAGCGRSTPVSYYQLAPLPQAAAAGVKPIAGQPAIGIGPVRLEEHLDRPQLVLRSSANRLQLADSHRWVEPLAENISWVLRDNLAQLLASERLVLYPWERTAAPDFQVSLDILRCEKGADGTALLEALWTVADRDGTALLSPRRSSYQIEPATPDQEGVVGALSEALARLSRDIAAEISAGQKNVPVGSAK